MRKHPILATAFLYVAFCLLAGCQTLGVMPPETFREKVAAATTTANAASQSVLTLLQARKITPDESDRYTARIEDVQKAVDLARGVHSDDPTEAVDRLEVAILALQTITAELESRK